MNLINFKGLRNQKHFQPCPPTVADYIKKSHLKFSINIHEKNASNEEMKKKRINMERGREKRMNYRINIMNQTNDRAQLTLAD